MISFVLILFSFFAHPGDSLKAGVENYLKKNLSQYESFDFKLSPVNVDYKKIDLREDRDFNLSGNQVYIPVDIITKDGRAIRSIISVQVKLYKTILVLAKDIEKYKPLDTSNLVMKKMDITGIKGSTFTTAKNFEAYRAKAFLKKGEPLIAENIEPKPIILNGDRVEAKFVKGSVVVSFDVFSRQDGIPGGTIAVISKDKKQYKAKVIDSHNVTIIE